MVKKTKEDAEKTRINILQAARKVFLSRGVSKSSLEQVASEAGVTRGAVYWHFKNKSDVLLALRERVFLPLIDQMDDFDVENDPQPLETLEQFMVSRFNLLETCEETRETYAIMMTKCEFVDDLAEIMQLIMSNCGQILQKIVQLYAQAQQKGQISTSISAEALAMDSHIFFIGLLHMWIKDETGTQYRTTTLAAIKAHFALRRQLK